MFAINEAQTIHCPLDFNRQVPPVSLTLQSLRLFFVWHHEVEGDKLGEQDVLARLSSGPFICRPFHFHLMRIQSQEHVGIWVPNSNVRNMIYYVCICGSKKGQKAEMS